MHYDDWVEDFSENKLVPIVNIRQFIFYQTERMMLRNKQLEYKCAITWDIVTKYNIDLIGKTLSEIQQNELFILEKDFNDLMSLVIRLELLDHLHTYLFHNRISKIIYIIQIILNALFLICWLHILGVSFTISNLLDIFDILKLVAENISEPFSDTPLKL